MSAPRQDPASTWARFRKARVPSLMGVYAGASFAMLQGTDIFVDRLGLPNWTFFGTVVVLLAGIPVVIVTALVQQARRAEEGRIADGSTADEGRLADGATAEDGPAVGDDAGAAIPASAAAAPTPATARMRRIFTWRNTWLAGAGALAILAVVVGAFIGMRALGIGPVGSLVAAGVLEREEPILIADFQSHTGDDVLAGAATEAFRIDFEQSPLVRVVGPGQIRDAMIRMQISPDAPLTPVLARNLAVREGIKAILVGEINPAGRGSILSVRLISAETEETLVAFREAMPDSASIIPAVDQISNRLRERIGESLRSIRGSEPLQRVSTASLPALRLYSQGARAVDRDRDFSTGIAMLEEAVALDSTFAMAWRKLGVALANGGYPRDRWVEAFTRAYRHSDRLTDRERYLAHAIYHTHVLDDTDRAAAAYRAVLETHPRETTALNNLAGILAGRGDRTGAAELYRRALAVDSGTVIYYTNLLNQLGALGEWAEAEQILGRLQARFPDSPTARSHAAQFAAARGNLDEAARIFRELAGDPRTGAQDRIGATGNLSNIALIRGRLDEALRHLDEHLDFRRRAGQAVGSQERVAFELRARLFIAADTAGAVREADNVIAREGLHLEAAAGGAHLEAALFFAAAGRPDRAREFLDQWDRAPLDDAARERLAQSREWALGIIESAEGDHDRLFARLRRQQREDGCAWCMDAEIGALFDRTGAPDSAIIHYERYIEAPSLNRLDPDAFWLHRIHERLGELYAERGDAPRARAHLARFIELWQHADPLLQPRVEAARRRLGAFPAR